ncbi:hypothetical protein CTAYLR_006348 [Chrysophaeum taylorii]|uniref:Major facilitator superfamily (MFS) profile domain-containing protein n=1 Tax=Chrysophaeum taylorii TaxID=2483200 RepID=A0AAD7XF95_9STRA|nr:hypothetical protein CTAYLR_006348 [Chrysophaeum taylorii]
MYTSYDLLASTSAAPCRERWVVGVLIGVGIMQCYAVRSSMSVAVVGLGARYGWSESERGAVLSAFFWGYVAAMLCGPRIVATLGRARTFGTSVVLASALTALVPSVAPHSVKGACALRALAGAAEASTYPSVLALFERWAPDTEDATKTTRGKFVAIALGGDALGTILGFLVAGTMLSASGEPATFAEPLGAGGPFYVTAAIAAPWYLAWRTVDARKDGAAAPTLPWRYVASEPSVRGLFSQHLASNWCSYTLLTELPSFLNDRFDVSLDRAATLLVPVYVAYSIGQQTGGGVVDAAVNDWRFELATARLAIEWVSFAGAAAALLVVAFADTQDALLFVVSLVSLATFCLGLSVSGGWSSNFLDLAPNQACGLYTCSNFIANMAGILTPIVTSYLVHNPASWSRVFVLAALVNLAAVTFWSFTISTTPALH